MMTPVVVTVLKTGGPEYTEEHVERLYETLRWHNPKLDFVCLTDSQSSFSRGIQTIQLAHGAPGWWSKLEIFRDDIRIPYCLYVDLDTVFVDCLGFLNVGKPYRSIMMLEDVYKPGRGRWGSGVMVFDNSDGHLSYLSGAFNLHSKQVMQEYVTPKKWGDQAFIRDVLTETPLPIQKIYPGKFSSYKVQCQKGIPQGCSVVYFHGKPRPWNVELRREHLK